MSEEVAAAEDPYGKHVHLHSHQTYSIAKFTNHIHRWHSGDEFEVEIDEEHDHDIKVKERWNYAAHIDITPLQEKAMEDAEVVFFGIEGCLKQDSMWGAIRRSGARATVCSVPSVSLWGAPELERFTSQYLLGKTVIIVPDADWKKDAGKVQHVENHSRIFQGRLLNLGVQSVHIAAAPIGEDSKPIPVWNPWKGKMDEAKGIDDFIGLGNGLLHELVCIDYEAPSGVLAWVVRNGGASMQRRRREKLVSILRQLSVFSGSSGVISLPYLTLANVMNVPHRSMCRYIQDFAEMGALTVKGNLTAQNRMFGLDWALARPRIIIAEELRSVDRGFLTLEEVIGEKVLGAKVRLRPESGLFDLKGPAQ